MSVTIHPLTSGDEAEWLPLWQAYLDFYQAELSAETTRTTWQRITRSADVKGLGAFDTEHRLVGFVHIVIHPNTWNISPCCYLEDLFVAADCRRQGVARGLIEAVYRLAETEGFCRVYWITDTGNVAAQALYRTLAWQTDTLQYRKDFPPTPIAG